MSGWERAAVVVIWFLLASGLIFLTWNQVLAFHFKVKKASFFQACLVLATAVILIAPFCAGKRGMKGNHCDRPGVKATHDCQGDCKGACGKS